MGWDLDAYITLNQDEIRDYIKSHTICLECDWEWQSHFLKSKGIDLENVYYKYNKLCDIHELCVSYPVSFIRDDERFSDRRYHTFLEKTIGKPFPLCLKTICFYINDTSSALEVSNALETFFPNDVPLMNFAKWLADTAMVCDIYELNY
jgi:hypothetical protein